jgi:acetyltransferase-like isoleucine patch superfamily enzyme
VNIKKVIQRFLIPSSLIAVFYWVKFQCKVSPRAEVELSSLLTLGKRTVISSFTKIKASDGPLDIGSNVSVSTNCFISSGKGGITIGDDVMVGPHVSIVGNNYKHDRLDVPICLQEKTSKGIIIGCDVWIGAGSVILDGSCVGKGVIVTPNSVVSGKIPDYVIIQGNPAKVIFKRR